MFQTEVVERTKTRNLCFINFIWKSCRLLNNVEKIWQSLIDLWRQYNKAPALCVLMRNATNTHSEYVLLLFHGGSCYANASQCYVMRTVLCMSYFYSKYSCCRPSLDLIPFWYNGSYPHVVHHKVTVVCIGFVAVTRWTTQWTTWRTAAAAVLGSTVRSSRIQTSSKCL